jgi:hypothetical protein
MRNLNIQLIEKIVVAPLPIFGFMSISILSLGGTWVASRELLFFRVLTFF